MTCHLLDSIECGLRSRRAGEECRVFRIRSARLPSNRCSQEGGSRWRRTRAAPRPCRRGRVLQDRRPGKFYIGHPVKFTHILPGLKTSGIVSRGTAWAVCADGPARRASGARESPPPGEQARRDGLLNRRRCGSPAARPCRRISSTRPMLDARVFGSMSRAKCRTGGTFRGFIFCTTERC